jgi:hypothetical protein
MLSPAEMDSLSIDAQVFVSQAFTLSGLTQAEVLQALA